MPRRALIAVATFLAVLLTAAPAHADWVWPVNGEVITPYRNGDDPYAAGQHRGIDISAHTGTTVVAATAGDVRFAGTAGSSGLTVSIRTGDGLFDTSYLHLSSTAVSKGQRVAAGDLVGAVGTTGVRSAERPHLHFGVRDAGSRHAYRDPLAFLPPPALTPERPRAAPAPNPAPVPLVPRPDPVRVPAPRRAPRRAPTPRRAPKPRSAPRPAPLPRNRPVPAPRGAPARAPIPHHAPGRAPIPHGTPAPAPAAHHAPAREHTPGHLPAAHHAVRADLAAQVAAADARSPSARVSSTPERGPDIGWSLACLGLLAAAALLGLSEDGREVTRRGHQRITALLSPRPGAP